MAQQARRALAQLHHVLLAALAVCAVVLLARHLLQTTMTAMTATTHLSATVLCRVPSLPSSWATAVKVLC